MKGIAPRVGLTILDAIRDPKVFAPFFQGASWDAWKAFLCSLFALPMTEAQLATYRQCTGRTSPPDKPLFEAWLVCGRRAGKSFMLAVVAVFLATFKDWRRYLGPGEVGTVMIIANDRRQARVILRYVKGLLEGTPMLKRLVIADRAEGVELSNRIAIEVHTASFRAIRGYSVVAGLLDEVAIWRSDESSDPDAEILAALRPCMSNVPGSMLLAASSPYSRRGILWNAYQKHFGKDGSPVLVWQAATRVMNANVPQATIDAALAEDPARYSAEYLAQFRDDIAAFVSREAVEACVSQGVFERAPEPHIAYEAFADPSGGSSDAFTLAIGHKDRTDRVILDCLREVRAPFSPSEAVAELAGVLASYKVGLVVGDKYAGMWPTDAFNKFGIAYQPSPKPKSDLYVSLLPLINSGTIDLLDDKHLFNQLIGLERRTARSGKDSIDHAPGAHDDVANAVAGLGHMLSIDPEDWLAHQEVSLVGPQFFVDGQEWPPRKQTFDELLRAAKADPRNQHLLGDKP